MLVIVLQVLDLINGFYRQTYEEYGKTRDEGLKETLRLIQNEVRLVGLNSCFLFSLTNNYLDR